MILEFLSAIPMVILAVAIVLLAGVSFALITYAIVKFVNKKTEKINEAKYKELESEVLKKLNFPSWDVAPYLDEHVIVKSRQTLEKYDEIKFFKENKDKLATAKDILNRKQKVANVLRVFLKNNDFTERSQYDKLKLQIYTVIKNTETYRIGVTYISSAGNNLGTKAIELNQNDFDRFDKDPSLLMGKGEYNKFKKETEKEALNKRQTRYYGLVDDLINYANENRDSLFIKGSVDKLDNLIAHLFDRTVNSIKNIKDVNSEEWDIINSFILNTRTNIKEIVNQNQIILKYYESPEFLKIKRACEVLMSSQREFNEYISEKVDSISQLFGTRITRNETVNEDEYQYIRPYKKTISPFTAEVSKAVFGSAERNSLEYVIKYFYPNKEQYPEQIRKLHLLIEELETLKEAKQIIDNHKKEYQQYINDVPDYVMQNDAAGFYSRLGFAYIDESVLTVEYTFSYTSDGGKAKRTFPVPMTEENIIYLIKALEEKLTMKTFTKEQRALMTTKLRNAIKQRDNFTCCCCGNSIHTEPNLLLEIDHIIPVSKGGCTTEENLQTLCWKCNRAKSNKTENVF